MEKLTLPKWFNPSRGGHSPGDLREAFGEMVEREDFSSEVEIDGIPTSPQWVIGQLWNCSDIMPSYLCGCLELGLGSTYARAVRYVKDLEGAYNRS